MSSSLKGARVLVTGGGGHIGSHVVDDVLRRGAAEVVVYDNFAEARESNLAHLGGEPRLQIVRRDIRDFEDLRRAMKGCDVVFHVASILLLECRDHPRKALDVNVNGTLNVILAALECNVRKIVFSSTGSVYGEPLRLPMDEDHPYNSETIYGTTKIAGEHLFRDYAQSNGLAFVGLRYFNVYGPRQHYKGAYAQIVPRWFDRILAGEDLVVHGDGSQTMDMTYVTDIARANVLAAESTVQQGFYNVGTGTATSVLQVAQLMQKICGVDTRITFVPQDVNLVKNRMCSTVNAKRDLGFEAMVTVEQGLRDYFAWKKEQRQRSGQTVARV